jgi:protein ImuB
MSEERERSARVACATMVDPAWSALFRREPAIAEQRLAIVDDDGARGVVLAMSPAAQRAGVRAGQRIHRARAIAGSLVVRVEDAHGRASAREALCDAALSLSPSVELDRDRVFLDARGVRGRFESEEGFAAALVRACEKVGLAVSVAIARGRRTTAALARSTGASECVVVPEGRERAALSRLEIAQLELDPKLLRSLDSLGIHTVEALAQLDPSAVAARLGEPAADAVRLARGEDRSPIVAQPKSERFEERASFEWELTEVEPLLFLCKRLFDNAVSRLACRSLSSRQARVSFALRAGRAHERVIHVGAPTREVPVWLRLLRASLDAAPPPDAVVGAKVELIPCAPRAVQLGLFDPPGPAPEKWALALARIEAIVGHERVGAPCAASTHRPGEVRLAEFDSSVALREEPRAQHTPVAPRFALALHVFRPPKRARVRYEHGAIRALASEEISGRVERCAGPYRRVGQWWTSEPFAQDSWDVALEDRTLLRVAYDGRTGEWTVEGRYE